MNLAYSSRIEFISFEHRVASLAWLSSKIEKNVDLELSELRAIRAAGTHRVKGWESESDEALDESVFMLDSDIRQISVNWPPWGAHNRLVDRVLLTGATLSF
ncbi:hypothetical protein OHA63_24285 [Streptomyces anulatus]|uniref:hypothetical protein n=1 Tax=Streptomyces anulatus TaxID=1892 RepID=UPI002E369855|nr:hypothetical protein [Streptomyces anulatus]